jgi:hypothetical protein
MTMVMTSTTAQPVSKTAQLRIVSTLPHAPPLAENVLSGLAPKWNPDHKPSSDNLTLTRHRKEKNQCVRLESKAPIFDPSVTAGDPIDDGFQVFVNPSAISTVHAFKTALPQARRGNKVVVYTDGSCVHNGAANATAGAGVWFVPNDERNFVIRVPGPNQSNQAGELLALHQVVTHARPSARLHIK